MPQTFPVLGQTVVVADTDTTLYTVPAATEAVVSSVVACNIGSTVRTYRVAMRLNGAAVANQMYLFFDATIDGNSSRVLTAGLTMSATGGQDILMVRANHADVVFSAYGSEIT